MVPVVAIVLLLCCFPAAQSQSIYKCTYGGKIAYADRPCEAGDSLQLALPQAPAPDPEAAQLLARRKAALAAIEKQRRASAAVEAKTAARAGKAAAQAERRCARLRLRQRWHDEEVARALSEQRDALRRKAQRHRQTMAIECRG